MSLFVTRSPLKTKEFAPKGANNFLSELQSPVVGVVGMPNVYIKILISSFNGREHMQEKDTLLPDLKASATQAPSVTLTISNDESQRKAYCNFLDLIRQSIH